MRTGIDHAGTGTVSHAGTGGLRLRIEFAIRLEEVERLVGDRLGFRLIRTLDVFREDHLRVVELARSDRRAARLGARRRGTGAGAVQFALFRHFVKARHAANGRHSAHVGHRMRRADGRRHIRPGTHAVIHRVGGPGGNSGEKRNHLRSLIERFRGDRENVVLVGGVRDVGIGRILKRRAVDVDVGVNIDELGAVVGGLVIRIGVDDARFDLLEAFLRLRRRFAAPEFFAEIIKLVGLLVVKVRRLACGLLRTLEGANRADGKRALGLGGVVVLREEDGRRAQRRQRRESETDSIKFLLEHNQTPDRKAA